MHKFGDKGEDVRALQKFLNCAGFSLGADGPGSRGDETPNFADRTLKAVNAFQQEYAYAILTPIDTTKPTGIFAHYSEAKAYTLMQSQ
jgi:peptidoglycan hydrolase-like protein with peptidoglycan-binding domain